jgi:hypothetical protein
MAEAPVNIMDSIVRIISAIRAVPKYRKEYVQTSRRIRSWESYKRFVAQENSASTTNH